MSSSPGSARHRCTVPVGALLARFRGSPDQGSARSSLASGFALLTAPALMIVLREVSDVRRAYMAVPVLLAGLVLLAQEPARALPARAMMEPNESTTVADGVRRSPLP